MLSVVWYVLGIYSENIYKKLITMQSKISLANNCLSNFLFGLIV